MKLPVTLVVVSFVFLGSWLPGFGSDGQPKPKKPAYVAPYGLTAENLGKVKAPKFLAAILGKGTEAEQEAALAVFTAGQPESIDEISKIGKTFQRKSAVQAAVWRDTTTGKIKRADDKTRFDPDRDRVEFVFANLDVKAIQAQARGVNPVTPESQKWVADIAPLAKNLQAIQAIPGILGGAGDPRSGNIIPLYAKAKVDVDELQDRPIFFARGIVTWGDPLFVFMACEYRDKTTRIPTRVGFYMTVGMGVSGRFVDNKDE